LDQAEWLRRRSRGEAELRAMFLGTLTSLAPGGEVRFVQVGGNDGQMADPLAPHIKDSPWRGVIVEPVPFYFRALQALHGQRASIDLVNAACSKYRGELTLWAVSPEAESKYPYWARGLATSSPEHFTKHKVDIADCVELRVPCLTVAELCEQRGMKDLDLLCVDVEGHELQVFQGVDFSRVRISSILYERKHMKPDEEAAIESLLEAAGFVISKFYQDAIAVHRSQATLLAVARGGSQGFKALFA